MTEVAQDASVETLPASLTFLALRFGIVALLIPIVWLWAGAAAGVATAVALASIVTLFAPRALVLDEEGFRQLSLVPRKKVLWRGVDSFKTGAAPKVGAFVLYTKAGQRARWWYPAGWPAQGGLPPAFGSARGGRALSSRDLSDFAERPSRKSTRRFRHLNRVQPTQQVSAGGRRGTFPNTGPPKDRYSGSPDLGREKGGETC